MARVLDLGRFLLIPCVTRSSVTDPSPFLFVKASGVSFYHFLFSSLLYLRLLWIPNESPHLPGHKASTQQSCLRRRHDERRVLTLPCLVAQTSFPTFGFRVKFLCVQPLRISSSFRLFY